MDDVTEGQQLCSRIEESRRGTRSHVFFWFFWFTFLTFCWECLDPNWTFGSVMRFAAGFRLFFADRGQCFCLVACRDLFFHSAAPVPPCFSSQPRRGSKMAARHVERRQTITVGCHTVNVLQENLLCGTAVPPAAKHNLILLKLQFEIKVLTVEPCVGLHHRRTFPWVSGSDWNPITILTHLPTSLHNPHQGSIKKLFTF